MTSRAREGWTAFPLGGLSSVSGVMGGPCKGKLAGGHGGWRGQSALPGPWETVTSCGELPAPLPQWGWGQAGVSAGQREARAGAGPPPANGSRR